MSELKAETIVAQGTTITLQMYPKSEVDKVIAHHKFKRCLAMAGWCRARYSLWPKIFSTEPTRKMKFLDKWEKRWLEIAEKFKEAKQ